MILGPRENADSILRAVGYPTRLVSDSRRIGAGDAFAAYPGERADGRAFIPDALRRGAGSVLWEESGFAWNADWAVPNAPVAGLKHRLGELADLVYGQPSRAMRVVGVTGTNGKTSCTHWIAQASAMLGLRSAVLGTLGNGFVAAEDAESMEGVGDAEGATGAQGAKGAPGAERAQGTSLEPAENTTVDAALLQETLARFRREGARVVAMEVSSHGLDQGRVDGTRFDTAVFTNLSRDHLDYHGTMESYARAKAKLFDTPGIAHAVINVGDAFGATLARAARDRGVHVVGYRIAEVGEGERFAASGGAAHDAGAVAERGVYGAASGFAATSARSTDIDVVRAENVRHLADGLAFDVRTPWGDAAVRAPVSGTFNVANLLAVLSVLCVAGVPVADAARVLGRVRAPAGRMQRLGGNGRPRVVIDYAHSPDALAKVLAALRPSVAPGSRLVCVFGCGGDRDRGKRPEMGRIAEQQADAVVLTSDNPRSEDPRAILDEIRAGLAEPARAVVEPDRAAAIASAVASATAGDLVLVAGKGHEPWQEIAGERHAFSDAEHAAAALARWSGR